MDKKYTIRTVIYIMLFVVSGIFNFLYSYINLRSYTRFLYVSAFLTIGLFFCAVLEVWEWRKHEKGQKLGETLFLNKVGAIPDKIKVLSLFTYKYDQVTQGISSHSVRIKFWSQNKVYKGIVDIKKEKLYINEPMMLPVYTGDPVLVWKEVISVYKHTVPKKVEYYDADENLCGIDYLDKEGNLKKGSLRRYKGREVYWFPQKGAWEP
ncbi:MAG: hypothetical protein PVF58_14440 [Candidatus Methanofastidiosia archaeon]